MRRTATVLGAAIVLTCGPHAAAQVAGQSPDRVIQLQPDQPAQPVRREGPAGKVELGKQVIDFGKILDTKEVSDSVEIRNTGAGPLTIITVSTSCGCTVGSIGDRTLQAGEGANVNYVIEPGKSAPLNIKFNPHGKSHAVSQRVTLVTDDPDNPTVGVDVKALVNPVVKVEPMVIDVGMLRKGEMGTMFAAVLGRLPGFEVTAVAATVGSGEWVHAAIVGRSEDTDEGDPVSRTEIEVNWDGTGKPGPVRGMLTLSTNDPERPTVNASIIGTILGDIAVAPERVMLGMMNPGATLEKTLRVTHRDGKPFEIKGLDEKSNNEKKIEWKAVPVGAGRKDAYDVVLTVTGNSKPGAIRGSITLLTDVADEERIDIVFYGVVSTASAVGGPQPSAITASPSVR